MKKIPENGSAGPELLARLADLRANDLPWRSGRVWAYVYPPGDDTEKIQKAAYMEFLSENALDPTAFPSLRHMENDIISMCASHLHGDQDTVGSFTSGGTESCLLAVKTARDWARKERGIKEPEIIVSSSAHAAFFKAAHYFDVKIVVVPVDNKTLRADVEKIRAAINPNTALVVASASAYAHGVVDPVEEIAAITKKAGILLHVDGCIGGFLLNYFRELGAKVPQYDFAVDGVTSMSMDLHKYAYCPKGASVVLYKNRDLRKHQIFTCAGWNGYAMVNPTVQSTKSGGPVAAAWATMHAVGNAGYKERARSMLEATRKLCKGIDAIPGLKVIGNPEMCLVAFVSEGFSIFHLIDAVNKRGWYVQAQLQAHDGAIPESAHLTVTTMSEALADEFLADLAASIPEAKAASFGPLAETFLPMAKQLSSADMSDDMIRGMLESAGLGSGGQRASDPSADVNAILNAMSPEMRERILSVAMSELFRQPT
ncbi:MAG: aminotransferase class V-fold PLP-dependent enzyme [Polyangiaceae bacterium]